MRNAPTLIAAVYCLLAGPAASATQELRLLRDSLAVMGDVSELRSLEKTRTRGEAGAATRIGQGFIALRLYEVSGDRAALKRARRAFEAAVKAAPDDPWAQYGLGVTLARSPEAHPINEGGARGRIVLDDIARGLFGRDEASRARNALAAAAQAEPPVPNAAAELADLSLSGRNHDALETARSELRRLYTRGAASATDLLALARIESVFDDQSAAVTAADAALAGGVDRSLGLHARSAALLRSAGREEEGARAWLDGVASLSPEGARRYWHDLTNIATPAERTRWKQGDLTARKEMLAKFWDLRAALGGVHVRERLAEHYRRLATADADYRRNTRFGAPESNELRWLPAQQMSRFDDRGEIYLRHGPPTEVIRSVSRLGTNETWLYVLPDGSTQIFPFFGARGNYTLPWTIPCDPDFLRTLAGYDARLGLFSIRCDPMNVASYSATMRERFFNALESDSKWIEFAREIPFLYDLYTFRGTNDRTTVVAAFAVPAKSLKAIEQDGRVFYRLNVSLILADTALGTVSRTNDSTRIARTHRLRSADMVRTHIEVENAAVEQHTAAGDRVGPE